MNALEITRGTFSLIHLRHLLETFLITINFEARSQTDRVDDASSPKF